MNAALKDHIIHRAAGALSERFRRVEGAEFERIVGALYELLGQVRRELGAEQYERFLRQLSGPAPARRKGGAA